MPPAIGAGELTPGHPSDPVAARALALYESRLAGVDAAPWRATPDELAEAERYRAAIEDREPAAWALTPAERERRGFSPAEWAAVEHDAAVWRRAADPLPTAHELARRSLDTWEHLHTSNSGDDDPPARARDGWPVPPGQPSRAPDGDASPEAARDASRDRERVERYDRAKATLAPALRVAAGALAALDPEAPGPAFLDRMADRVHGCRTVRAFRDAGCGAVLVQPFSCDVRLCPDCERSRSAAYVRRLDELATAMRRPLFGTLTIPNVPAGMLGLGLDVLTDAWARFRRTALFVGGPCRNAHQHPDDRPDAAGELPPARARCRHAPHRAPESRACSACGRRKAAHATSGCTFAPKPCPCARCMRNGRGCRRCVHAPVVGGVAGIEVTFSAERRDWHPHLHFVADAPFLPWRELRDGWRAATCDAFRANLARGADLRRSAGYRRPDRRGRVELAKCRHLADAEGRPADRVCLAGHGWRARDSERCPYRDRGMTAPCGRPGDEIPEPERCRGASMTWVQAPRAKDGAPAGLAAVREAVKYATKGVIGKDGELVPALREDPLLLAELLLVLRNRRLVTGWGSFHGVTDDPDGADRPELVDVDTGELFPSKVPKVCPSCGVDGLWEHVGIRPRGECLPGATGRLYWRPPGRGGPH